MVKSPTSNHLFENMNLKFKKFQLNRCPTSSTFRKNELIKLKYNNYLIKNCENKDLFTFKKKF